VGVEAQQQWQQWQQRWGQQPAARQWWQRWRRCALAQAEGGAGVAARSNV